MWTYIHQIQINVDNHYIIISRFTFIYQFIEEKITSSKTCFSKIYLSIILSQQRYKGLFYMKLVLSFLNNLFLSNLVELLIYIILYFFFHFGVSINSSLPLYQLFHPKLHHIKPYISYVDDLPNINHKLHCFISIPQNPALDHCIPGGAEQTAP